jgi:creatinine amidohydrolase
MSEPVLWAKLSWAELEALATRPPHMALWPMGSIEQHGKHLPVDVDVRNCWEVAYRVSATTRIPVLPAMAFGDSRYWEGWPGTLTLQPETFVQVILDVCHGVVRTGFQRLILLNGHIGNNPVLAMVEGRIRDRFPALQIRTLGWWDVSPRVSELMYADSIEGTLRSFHGNDGETSVYMAHSPELVHLEFAVDEPVDYQRPVFSYHSRQLTTTGCVGRPRAASAEKGRRILGWAVEDLAALIERGTKEPMPVDVWTVKGKGA